MIYITSPSCIDAAEGCVELLRIFEVIVVLPDPFGPAITISTGL